MPITGPEVAADVAVEDPTAQQRRAVAHETACNDWTGAGRPDATTVPCQGAASVDEVDEEGDEPDEGAPPDDEPQAAAVPRATTQTTRAARRPRVRVEARVAGTAHPSLAGPVATSAVGRDGPIARDCATDGLGGR